MTEFEAVKAEQQGDVPVRPVRKEEAQTGRGLGGLALLVACCALIAVLTQPLWASRVYGPLGLVKVAAAPPPLPVIPAPPPPPAVDLSPLEARLSTLESARAESSTPTEPAADLQGEVQTLRATVDSLQAAHSALKQELAARQGGEDVADKAVLVAILQLVMAWQNGQPFGTPWETVMTVVEASDPQLAALLRDAAPALLPLRDKGLPTLSALQGRFGEVARAVVQAAQPQGGTWWEQALQNVKGLVTIRRVGTPAEESAPDTVDSLLAQAESLLQKGNLADVTALLGRLNQLPGVAAAQSWLLDARARLEADDLSRQMMGYVAKRLTPDMNPQTGTAAP